MANLEYSLLKAAVAKASGLAFPLGLVAVAALWAWRVRDRRSPAPAHREDNGGAGSMGDEVVDWSPHEAMGSAHAAAHERRSYRAAPDASFCVGSDREALLSRILEDNIRLREALK